MIVFLNKSMKLTKDHPFYENIKSYPKCFNMLGGNNMRWNAPKAIFCVLQNKTNKPSKNKNGELATIMLTENGANIYSQRTNTIFLDSSNWEMVKPYVENSEYICYSE